MTEEDAKTKWCPMVRAATYSGASINRDPINGNGEAKCVGAGCMMWRWDVVPEQVGGGKNWDGHCGLAPMRGPESIPPAPAVIRSDVRAIGKGVYSNPQPGDADHGK